jgi:hypothetical protein
MLAAVIAVAAAVAVYEWRRAGHSSPVSRVAAVRSFRASGSATGGRPPPGVYTYAVTGWECAGIGPVCLHRTLPPIARIVVTRRGDVLTIETDLSRQHVEAQRYRITAAGRMLVWQRTKLSILGVTQDDATATTPATLALPAHLRTGYRWTQRFHAGGVRVVGRNRVLGDRRVRVGGSPVTCTTVAADSVTAGPHPGTEHDRDCIAPRLGLDLRFSTDRDIRGTFPYRLHLTAVLRSLTPMR